MEALDIVLQSALDIFHKYALEFGENREDQLMVSLQPARVLANNGLSHTDSQRAYNALKRLGLIKVVTRGRGVKETTILMDINKSVKDRRREKEIERQNEQRKYINATLLEYYSQQETLLEVQLERIRASKTKLIAKMESDNSLQPT